MALADLIPLRSNADDVDSSWWNSIRTAIGAMLGYGITYSSTPFTIADNQSSYADITGLVFDKDSYQAVKVWYTIFRTDATTPRREVGFFWLMYDSTNGWTLSRTSEIPGSMDALNIADSLAVTSAGQVQYKSDSMGGTYQGFMQWKAIITFAAEV